MVLALVLSLLALGGVLMLLALINCDATTGARVALALAGTISWLLTYPYLF